MAFNCLPQERQWERGLRRDSPLGIRSAARLMKLPTIMAAATR